MNNREVPQEAPNTLENMSEDGRKSSVQNLTLKARNQEVCNGLLKKKKKLQSNQTKLERNQGIQL